MSLLQIVVLALVQGITEFLPISSYGHLVVASDLAGWPDQTLKFDIALHVGTLAAVVVYFWRDLWLIGSALIRPRRRGAKPGRRLGLHLLLATLPVLLAGGLVHGYVPETFLRDPLVIALATIVFGALLYGADRYGLRVRRLEHMTLGAALFIGFAQAIALIPGTSRAGITMTAARLLGFERAASARFSMLLAIPTIIAAGALAARDLYQLGDLTVTREAALAAALSFVVALISIWGLLKWLERMSFTPFVVYRLLMGGALLVWLLA